MESDGLIMISHAPILNKLSRSQHVGIKMIIMNIEETWMWIWGYSRKILFETPKSMRTLMDVGYGEVEVQRKGWGYLQTAEGSITAITVSVLSTRIWSCEICGGKFLVGGI